jgi:hypothetical protein
VTPLNRLIGFAAALAATVALASASSVRMTAHASQDSVLRLAWSARPERVEDCRTQSDEALAKLPPHMRQAVVCEGTTASYRLLVLREGAAVLDQIVRGGGLRHDRALYVFRDVPVPAGESRISVRFDRVDAATTPASEQPGSELTERGYGTRGMGIDPARRQREADERIRQRGEAVPRSLSIDRSLRFIAHQVILVTYDPEGRTLLTVTAPDHAPARH